MSFFYWIPNQSQRNGMKKSAIHSITRGIRSTIGFLCGEIQKVCLSAALTGIAILLIIVINYWGWSPNEYEGNNISSLALVKVYLLGLSWVLMVNPKLKSTVTVGTYSISTCEREHAHSGLLFPCLEANTIWGKQCCVPAYCCHE